MAKYKIGDRVLLYDDRIYEIIGIIFNDYLLIDIDNEIFSSISTNSKGVLGKLVGNKIVKE